jgi:hypothetical protein
VFKAIADVLKSIGGAIATVVTLPFRAVARLFGGASDTAHGQPGADTAAPVSAAGRRRPCPHGPQ